MALGDVNADRKPDIVTADDVASTASVLLNTTAMALSFTGDTLHLTPPPASTVGTVNSYVLHYNTEARAGANKPWGIWATGWPAGKLGIDLAANQTVAGCLISGATICTRLPVIGEQTSGTTRVYRLYANVTPPGGGTQYWTPSPASPSPDLRLQRLPTSASWSPG